MQDLRYSSAPSTDGKARPARSRLAESTDAEQEMLAQAFRH